MAEVDYDDYGGSPRFNGQRAQRMINLAGALCSVGLVIGVGVWGYRLAVRDVAGVPVIRASHEPMRVPPASPGGEIADHQGMAVNIIAEKGAVDQMPEEIILAPSPVELSLEDQPGLSPALPPNVSAVADSTGSQAPVADAPTQDAPAQIASVDMLMVEHDPTRPNAALADAPMVAADGDAIALALAAALAEDVAPLGDVEPLADTASDETPVAGAVTRSLRPMPRPDGAGLTQVRSVSAEVGPIAEIDPATLTVGTRLVQLGAFDTGDQARGEWTKLTGKFGDLMSGKSAVVQTAQSGGRTFYRLRAHGFDGEDDSRRFCTALLAEGAACIPVAHR
jgi:hypothetical protein